MPITRNITIKCDRCDKEETHAERSDTIINALHRYMSVTIEMIHKKGGGKNYALCPDCTTAFGRFMEGTTPQ